MGADRVAIFQYCDLRAVLLRDLDALRQFAISWLDSSDPGNCVSRIPSPYFVGTNIWLGAALLHFGVLAINSERHFLAGLAIGSLIFKPQLALAAAAIFLFSGEWRTVLGAISAAAAAQLALAWAHYGTTVMQSYLQALSRIPNLAPLLEPPLYQTHSL